MKTTLLTVIAAFLTVALSLAQQPDLLLADFEGPDYGPWKTTGEAFGPGPARGTLPGQMQVDGFKGKGLVNSFYKGDGTTGALTSPEFKIERKLIGFLQSVAARTRRSRAYICSLTRRVIVLRRLHQTAAMTAPAAQPWLSWREPFAFTAHAHESAVLVTSLKLEVLVVS